MWCYLTDYLFKNGLYVPKIIDQVRKDNRIKPLVQYQVMYICLEEMEIWVLPTGLLDHIWGKVYTHTIFWLERGQ